MENVRTHHRDRHAAGYRIAGELRKKHNRKYRLSRYGLTEADFDKLLESQDYRCGMCRSEFEDGLTHIDHDHGCCQERNGSCGKCVRGLLCHRCNIALGYVEAYRELADAYLIAAQAARRPTSVESPGRSLTTPA
jgi:hypothetical protein